MPFPAAPFTRLSIAQRVTTRSPRTSSANPTPAIDDIRAEERQQREDRRGRVAAGAGDPCGALDLPPVKLRDAIDEAIEAVRTRMRRAVPAVVVGGVPQTVVARQIDEDAGPILELVRSMGAVWQGKEEHVAAAHVLVVDECEAGPLA